MKINIGLNDKDRAGVVSIVNQVLADEYTLYTETRNYHWNIVGPHFSELHKFFEAQYEELDGFIDDIAERARALGGHAIATLKEMHELARLKEPVGDYPSADKMIANLLANHENVIRSLRVDLVTCAEKFHDMGTSDFLTGLMEKHEKMAWMLRSFSK